MSSTNRQRPTPSHPLDAFAETAPAAFRLEPQPPKHPPLDSTLDLCDVTIDIDLPKPPVPRSRP